MIIKIFLKLKNKIALEDTGIILNLCFCFKEKHIVIASQMGHTSFIVKNKEC